MSDYQLEDTVYLPFTTRAFSTGIPTALVSGEVQIYEDASTTQITAAETLTVSLDGIGGFNMVAVAATAANGFGGGQSYTAILSAGTVDSVSAIGEVVGHFTLDMSAAAKDLANATDGLGALKTLIDTILVDTNELQGDDVPGLIAALDAVVDTVKAETALIVADTNELQTDDIPTTLATLATTTELNKVPKSDGTSSWNATALAAINAEADTALTDYDAATGTEVAALNNISVADILTTQMTEAYAADGAAPTLTQALMMIQQLLGEFAISGTTLTMKKVDGSTTGATFTLDDGTNPTSLTRAT